MTENGSKEQKIIELVENLADEETFPVMHLIDLPDPRQMELFWIDSPLEYQYLAITHDEYRDNNEVIINGPFSGSEFLDEVEDILHKPRWVQPVDDEAVSRYDHAVGTSIDASVRNDTIVNVFQGIEQDLGSEIFREGGLKIRQLSRLEEDSWLLFFRGNLFEADSAEEILSNTFVEWPRENDEGMDEEEQAEEGMDEEEQAEEGMDEEANPRLESDPNALGTYIYEPVWIGGVPDLDFKDRILVNPPSNYDTVYSTEIDGHEVIITKDGFVGVDESDEEGAVLDLLNQLFGVSALIGHPFEAATRNDLIEFDIDEDGNASNREGTPSLRRRHATPQPVVNSSKFRFHDYFIEREVIEIDFIRELCSVTKNVYQNEGLNERVKSTLQAFTHHVNGEYTQAFLLAWISIEQYVNTKLDEHLKEEKNVNSDRRRNMQRGGHWSASHLIELMEVSNCITEERYEKITKFRKKRNEIVHNTDSAQKQESKEIVNLSFKILDEEIDTVGTDNSSFI